MRDYCAFIFVLFWILPVARGQEVLSDIPKVFGDLRPVKDAQLEQKFLNYEIYRIDAKAVYDLVHDPEFTNEMEWRLGNRTLRIQIYPHDIRNPDFTIQLLTDAGVELMDPGPNTTYRGWNITNPENEVRLTITEDWISGFITDDNGEELFIQPVKDFLSARSEEAFENYSIIYTKDDIIEDTTLLCGAPHIPGSKGRSSQDIALAGCVDAETAIAADYSMYVKFGNSASSLTDHLLSIKNLMEPNYDVFDVSFSVVTMFIVTTSNGDPWTSSTNYSALLNDFSCWSGTGFNGQLNCTGENGFGVASDVSELWTNRDFDGSVIGSAWIGTVCHNVQKTSVNQHFNSNNQLLRCLIAHEVGHNFGAGHDASATPWIMAPSVNANATQFSSASQSAINGYLGGYSCLGACCPDPAIEFDILSLAVTDCNSGNSTYTIEIELAHGGGNSSGFNVNIGGTNYFRNFSSSPQTVTISNLPADGSNSIPVVVSAVTSTEEGCDAVGFYSAPSAGCGLNAVANFNDCQLPPGWSRTSTNPYIWNGGDPLVQYEWKFDDADRYFFNYDQGNNAGSLLTIDGTCMAYFDDDLGNVEEYTGNITLTTAYYDVSNYENLFLEFDYNFHNFEFENGKPANDSYFEVDVWDGDSWVNIIHDETDHCPWTDVWQSTCATHVSMNIDAYKSDALRVRFFYTDGDNGDWTGMIALDNFRISGNLSGSDPCVDNMTINSSPSNGLFEAANSISTSGSIAVTNSATYNAPAVTLSSNFEVQDGAVFEVQTDGCNEGTLSSRRINTENKTFGTKNFNNTID